MESKCLIIAGESSGDRYGKNLIIEIKKFFNNIKI